MIKKTMFAATLVAALAGGAQPAQAADPVWLNERTDSRHDITVYRAESCGCCKGWIEHLEAHNFKVEDVVVSDVQPFKDKYGVPAEGASCHTAVIDGKVIEGHVPAQDIKALLAAKSDIRLLTVPGMPSGGPGMDWEGARKDAFKVYAVSKDEQISVFNEYKNY